MPTLQRLASFLPAALLAIAAACDSDSTGPGGDAPAGGIVVLNGFGQPGVTLLADTGTASTRIDFGDDFDGAVFNVANDTAVATSSSFGGDKLFVADLGAGTVETLQLPGGSNPAGAAFVSGEARFAVALRNTGQIALVRRTGTGTAALTLLDDAGLCPTDVVEFGGSLYSADANAACAAGTFASQGPARLIRVSRTGAEGDTIDLPGATGSSATVVVLGSFAYVAVSGEADFSGTPTFVASGTVTKVDLVTGQVAGSVRLPEGTYGAAMRAGADGKLYLAAYTATDFQSRGIFVVTPSSLAMAGGAAGIPLRRTGGALANCGAATADAAGNVYCVEDDESGNSTLLVFDASGDQVRAVPAGTGAVDVALR